MSAARNSLARSQQDSKMARDGFYSHLETFEKQKVRDIKEMWGDWIHAHILYHSKCLEVMTRAHNLISSIDEDEEMEAILRVTRAHQNSEDPLLASNDPDSPSMSRSQTPSTPNMSMRGSASPLTQSRGLRDSSLSVGSAGGRSPSMSASRSSLNSSQQSVGTPNSTRRSLQNSTGSAGMRASQQSAPRTPTVSQSVDYDDDFYDE